MELSDTRTNRMFAQSRPAIECSHCGTRLFVPEWSEYLEDGRIRHLWQCTTCGCSFETSVRLAAA